MRTHGDRGMEGGGRGRWKGVRVYIAPDLCLQSPSSATGLPSSAVHGARSHAAARERQGLRASRKVRFSRRTHPMARYADVEDE